MPSIALSCDDVYGTRSDGRVPAYPVVFRVLGLKGSCVNRGICTPYATPPSIHHVGCQLGSTSSLLRSLSCLQALPNTQVDYYWLIPYMSVAPKIPQLLTLMLLVANLTNKKSCKTPEKWLKTWHSGTHLRVLSESYLMNTNMTGFRCLSKIFCDQFQSYCQ